MRRLVLMIVFMILLGSVPIEEFKKMNLHQIVHLHELLQKKIRDLFLDCAATKIEQIEEDGFVDFYASCDQKKEKKKDSI
jgi:hypothetical protein